MGMMTTSAKNETKSRFDGTISYQSLYFVKPSLELEPLFTGTWGEVFEMPCAIKVSDDHMMVRLIIITTTTTTTMMMLMMTMMMMMMVLIMMIIWWQ